MSGKGDVVAKASASKKKAAPKAKGDSVAAQAAGKDASNATKNEEAADSKEMKALIAEVMEDSHSKWENYFQKLLAYKQRTGNTLVPNRYPEDPKLGHWVTLMRRLYKNRQNNGITSQSLTDERIKRLEEVDFQWATRDPRHVPWEDRYDELADFVKRFGHSQVPIGWQENVKLSNWVSTQRQEYKLMQKGRATRLTAGRITRLDKLNFIWEAQRGGPRRSKRAIVAVPESACPVHVSKKRKPSQYDAIAAAATRSGAPGFMPPGFVPGLMPMPMYANQLKEESKKPASSTLCDSATGGEPKPLDPGTMQLAAGGLATMKNAPAAAPATTTQPNALAGYAGYMGQAAQQQQPNAGGDAAGAASMQVMGQPPWQALPGGVFQHSGAAAAMAAGMFPIASPYYYNPYYMPQHPPAAMMQQQPQVPPPAAPSSDKKKKHKKKDKNKRKKKAKRRRLREEEKDENNKQAVESEKGGADKKKNKSSSSSSSSSSEDSSSSSDSDSD